MNKIVFYGSEAREKILIGVKAIVKAVGSSMGPKGRNTLIANGFAADYGFHTLPLKVSRDGVTIARAFDVPDIVEKVGVNIIKEAAEKTVSQAGDATTCTCVLAGAIIEKGIEAVNKGANPVEIKKGIDEAVLQVIDGIKSQSIQIGEDVEEIRSVATVSANGDKYIGDLIAEAYKKIGKNGVISIEESIGSKTEITISDGFEFKNGYISPYFITNQGKGICEYDNPYILLYDKKISAMQHIAGIVEATRNQGRSLIIICDEVEGEALAYLMINNAQKKISACAIKAPFFADVRREAMEDLAALTGATYISDIKGIDLKNVKLSHLGTARRAKITKDETVIIGGSKDMEAWTDTLNNLKMNLTQTSDERERTIIQNRIARLEGGIAVIKVGGNTEVEMKERLDRTDDAVRATKSAIEEGYVPGAGTALLRCEIAYNGRASKDFVRGQEIIEEVLKMPLKQICLNAGVNADEIVNEILNEKGSIGYNAATERKEDLLASGIIDATKVIRCAITNAASVAGMILTSEVMICDTF